MASELLKSLRTISLENCILTGELGENGAVLPVSGLGAKLGSADVDRLLRRKDLLALVPGSNRAEASLWGLDTRLLPVQGVKDVEDAVRQIEVHSGPGRKLRQAQKDECKTLSDVFGASTGEEDWSLYQPLPLLVELQVPDRPPRREGKDAETDSETEDDRRSPTPTERMFAEDLQRQTRIGTELKQVDGGWEKLFTAGGDWRDKGEADRYPDYPVPTLVLLAAPGGGKSTALRHLVRAHADGERIPVRLGFAGFKDQRKAAGNEWSETVIRDCLRQWVSERHQIDIAATKWQNWWERGRLLFLLDGLDELNEQDADAACGLINGLASVNRDRTADTGLPLIVTCRIADFHRHRAVLHDLPVFGLGIVPYRARQAYLGAYPGLTPEAREELGDSLTEPSLIQLAELPLGLALICWLRAYESFLEPDLSRASLYNRLITRLLAGGRGGRDNWAWKLRPANRHAYLERAAIALFSTGGERHIEFSTDQWLAAFNANEACDAQDLLDGAIHCGLILRREGKDPHGRPQEFHTFLHLTFLEHLAAGALAGTINARGWDKPLNLPGLGTKSGHQWLWSMLPEPHWTEVLLRLAGQLDKTPLVWLIQTLTRSVEEDKLLVGPCLAVRCAAEAAPAYQSEELTKTTKVAQDRLIYAWGWADEIPERVVPAAAFNHCLPAVVAMFERVVELPGRKVAYAIEAVSQARMLPPTRPVVAALLARLGDEDWTVRTSAAATLGAMGETAASEDVIDALLARLDDDYPEVACSASLGLGSMGEAAARKDVIGALLLQHDNEDRDVERQAIKSLTQIAKVAREEFIYALLQLCTDDQIYKSQVFEVLKDIGEAAARKDVIDALLAALHDENWCIRKEAAEALGSMGKAAARKDVNDALMALLSDEFSFVHYSAAWALGRMWKATGRKDVIDALLAALRDENGPACQAAAWALGNMGEAAARKDVIDTLLVQLKNGRQSVRTSATLALGDMGEAAARKDVIDALLAALHDENWRIRAEAATALGSMGKAAARSDVVNALLALQIEMVRRGESRFFSVRLAAADILRAADEDAIGAMLTWMGDDIFSCALDTCPEIAYAAESTALQNVIDDLLARLSNEDQFVRESAAQFLANLGEAAASDDVIDALVTRLSDEDRGVRKTAVDALGNMVEAAARNDVIDALLTLMCDKDWILRMSAENALYEIGKTAARKVVIDGLSALLSNEDLAVRKTAAMVLGNMGEAIAIGDVVAPLMAHLYEGGWYEGDWNGNSAARTLSQLGIPYWLLRRGN